MTDQIFAERYQQETSALAPVVKLVELYPANPVAGEWKVMLAEGKTDIQSYYDIADQIAYETDQLSMSEVKELEECGINL
jgi:hypothetical protein